MSNRNIKMNLTACLTASLKAITLGNTKLLKLEYTYCMYICCQYKVQYNVCVESSVERNMGKIIFHFS